MSYGEICKSVCPDYLAMGMTLKEYWDDDPMYAKYVRQTKKLRKEEANFNAWLQANYFYEALICASPLFHDWVKHPKPIPFLKEPYQLYVEEKESTQKQEDEKALCVQATLRSWFDKVNNKFEQKEKKEGIANG